MRRVFAAALLLAALAAAQAPGPTAGLERQEGFIPFYWNARTGHLLFALSPERLGQRFLLFTGLGSGVGSLAMFADRSTVGSAAVCRFERIGPRVLVIAENEHFRAPNGSEALKASVAASFPTAVLAALPVEGESGGDLIVDANPLVVRDAFDLIRQLQTPARVVNGQIQRGAAAPASWRLDVARSAVAIAHTRAFPGNTETEALLTFTSERPSLDAAQHMADASALTVREHESFVALPPPGYQVRAYDPRVGYLSESFEDFSQPYDRPLARQIILRWRLVKQDPSAALSEPVKPITFYLDPAIPEPMRSAIRRGALWWNQAFAQAGFKDALRIEDLPAGADPLDFRYPTIQWTNRSGRGWSVGMAQADPRTGEILHAVVQLDSFRMRTVHNYWDALVPPGRLDDSAAFGFFAPLDSLDPHISQEQLMLNRLALLACHEMGHVLGLQHNFIASTFGRGSVMDYYAPRITIRADGTADLSDAYMQGVGSYDRFAIQWGYAPGTAAQRNALVEAARRQGIVWGNSQDARWNAYDDGPDPVSWLATVEPVRDALLRRYGASLLRPGEPASDLAARFALVYLFHQYALRAALNTIGGAEIPPARGGDGQVPVQVWPAASQRRALALELAALSPAALQIPAGLWPWLGPQNANDPIMAAERYRSSAGYLLSPFDAARSVAEIVVDGLLDPQRLERLMSEHQEQAGALSADAVVGQLLTSAFPASLPAAEAPLAGVVQTRVADVLMDLAVNDEATPEVRALAWQGVSRVQALVATRTTPAALALQRQIALFLRNPRQNAPHLHPAGAPPGPPV
ncbi:MAG TPA: zinc-dependent metalloprotease [Terriglobales bacterium]|nr:zinc-dependent metalloprotease [Terriglobales bacterium]